MAAPAIGAMRERLAIQTNTPAALRVSSLTRVGTTATAQTATAHGYATGDYVTIAGADLAGFNGKVKITKTGATTFTYAVADTLVTPAAGTITATYASNAQGGVLAPWRALATIYAEMMPIRAMERLQMAAIQATTDYRFRVWVRADLSPQMRLRWTPRYPTGAAEKTLEISGVLPWDDGRLYMLIEAGEVTL